MALKRSGIFQGQLTEMVLQLLKNCTDWKEWLGVHTSFYHVLTAKNKAVMLVSLMKAVCLSCVI